MTTAVDQWFEQMTAHPQVNLFARWRSQIPCCPYVITRGKRKGEPCGKQEIRPLSLYTEFNPMCFDHMKHWVNHPQYPEFTREWNDINQQFENQAKKI
jgi:hypothetical protein